MQASPKRLLLHFAVLLLLVWAGALGCGGAVVGNEPCDPGTTGCFPECVNQADCSDNKTCLNNQTCQCFAGQNGANCSNDGDCLTGEICGTNCQCRVAPECPQGSSICESNSTCLSPQTCVQNCCQ